MSLINGTHVDVRFVKAEREGLKWSQAKIAEKLREKYPGSRVRQEDVSRLEHALLPGQLLDKMLGVIAEEKAARLEAQAHAATQGA